MCADPRRASKSRTKTEGTPGKASAARFAAFMKAEPTSGERLIHRVRQGYSVLVVKHAGEFFGIPEKRLFRVIGISASTAHRAHVKKRPLDPAPSERVHQIAIITREAIDVLGSEAGAKNWMLRPNVGLGNASPLDLLDTEIGANAVRRVLVAIAEGGVV